MKLKIIILLSILILAVGCEQKIGGDTDEHGCLTAAGYTWCPSTEKCQRMWEEYCEEYKDLYKEVSDFESCAAAGYPVMESYPRQCRAGDMTYVEVIDIENQAKNFCGLNGTISVCGNYVKVVSNVPGAEAVYYDQGIRMVQCSQVLSAECRNILELACNEVKC